jgi:chemotaxis protein histidine kinase CheA
VPVDPALRATLGIFLTEAGTIRQRATRALLEIERPEASASAVNEAAVELARGLHTLKGNAATFGLDRMAELMHRVEDQVVASRAAGGRMDARVADVVLTSLDRFVAGLELLIRDTDAEPELDDAFALLDRLAGGDGSASDASSGGSAAGQSGPEGAAPAVPMPVDEGFEEIGSWRVDEKTVGFLMSDTERLRELALRLDERTAQLDAAIASLARLRIPGEAFEHARTQLAFLRRTLGHDSEEVEEIVSSLEEGVRAICTLPVSTVLEPLRRLVRDHGRHSGKRAALSVVGGELSIDRRQLEALRGPLVQLVRNSLDHGIEMPAVRDAAGKHSEGAIVIRLEQQGNLLFVEVSDDGAGIDQDRVREVAVRRGIATPEAVAAMERRELYELLFRSGFSTSTEVTETSGRGVGLDIVREEIRALGGQLDVLSEPGQGTRFVLGLPAELGSSPTLVLRAGDVLLGVPMAVVETVLVPKVIKVRMSAGQAMLEHRDRLLRIKDLGTLLGLRHVAGIAPGQSLVIVQSQGQHAAIAVDELVGDRDLVIRPLPDDLRNMRSYLGAATLARGEVLLVLRPDWLAEQQEKQPERARGRRVLVVDDSITARAMHRTALESGGMVVHTASSAESALEKLGTGRYDAIVCDLRMEGMDGLELVRTIRGTHRTRDVPVVLVTVEDDEATARLAAEAGADAYLPKRSCATGRLLSEVEKLLARRRTA